MAKIHNIKNPSPVEPDDDADEAEEARTRAYRAEAVATFHRAWFAWLQARTAIQKYVAEEKDITDEASEAEDDAMWGLIKVPSPSHWAVKHKIEVLMHLFDPSRWADGRDVMLAASILRDLDSLSPVEPD